MPYLAVENFAAGLDRRKSIMTAPPGTLWVLNNAHITRGGEIEKRKAFVEDKTLPTNSFGLHSVRGNLYVFGSVAPEDLSPALPSGVNYQRLQHPNAAAMSKLLFTENFDGKIYAIAQFDNGDVYHYYDGTRVTSWDTIAASVASNSGVATALANKIDLAAAYMASAVGTEITITAAVAGTPFTYAKSTVNGGTNPDQDITLVETTPNQPAVSETLSSFSFRVTGGSASAGVNKMNSITIDGVEVLGAAVDWTTSNSVTAAAIASQINSYTSSPDYSAVANGPEVTISAAAGTGAGPNGFVVAITNAGNLTTNVTSGNLSGGVTAVSAAAQVVTATIEGTFEAADIFTITLDGVDYTVSGAASGTGRTVRTLKGKMYSTTQSLMYFCANGNPNQWGSGTGSGFINMSNQDGGSEDLTALGVYQRNMAVFSKNAIQIWFVDVDPAANNQLQVLPNIGTNAPRSVVSIAESDVFFLSRGVRSLRARDSSNSASVYDIGTPIDPLIENDYSNLTEEQLADAHGIIDPIDGRYWLAIGEKIYVFSFFPTSKISAWSVYEPGKEFTHFAIVGRAIYARATDNKLYLYGGTTGNNYDGHQVEVVLPYLDMKQPASEKEMQALDFALEGRWDVYAGFDPTIPDTREKIATLTGSTFQLGRVPMNGRAATHIGLRLVSSATGYAKLSNAIIHYSGGEVT